MPFFFRKSFHFGPLNVNVSSSGVGWSFGLLGFRIGKHPSGRWYLNFFKWGFGYHQELTDGSRSSKAKD
jgi:hypothetical protein